MSFTLYDEQRMIAGQLGIITRLLVQMACMKTRFSKLEFAIQTGIQEAIGVDFGMIQAGSWMDGHHFKRVLFFFFFFRKVLKGVDDGCKQSDCVFNGELLSIKMLGRSLLYSN
eukprot:TRINITY_DN16236_c3_g2_i1.p1 TRINITY_DN16236_c3_g2~~TRINITY_DN16236_c3_g2_i1.p1  ORF type:complete len:113 (-),score=12.45 TRINITY_DN16236_c3_g2_i1:56-394(-)